MQTPISVVRQDRGTALDLTGPPESVEADIFWQFASVSPSMTGSATSGEVTYCSKAFVSFSFTQSPIARNDDEFLRRALLRGGRLIAKGRLSTT